MLKTGLKLTCEDLAVRHARRSPTNIADTRSHALLNCHDLVYDLMLPQIPGKAALAGRTEGAPHGAANLHAQAIKGWPKCMQLHRGSTLSSSSLH